MICIDMIQWKHQYHLHRTPQNLLCAASSGCLLMVAHGPCRNQQTGLRFICCICTAAGHLRHVLQASKGMLCNLHHQVQAVGCRCCDQERMKSVTVNPVAQSKHHHHHHKILLQHLLTNISPGWTQLRLCAAKQTDFSSQGCS